MEQITALFKTEEDADRVMDALKEAGFTDDYFFLGGNQTTSEEDVKMDMTGDGKEEEGVMITVQAEDTQADIAKNILKTGGAVQVTDTEGEWILPGWTGFAAVPAANQL